MIWKTIFGRSERESEAYAIYRALVSQARSPALYLRAGVPDTLEGRFEMVVLHAFLVLRRLKDASGAEAEPAKALGQRVFDILFDDMDQTLREIGVGDLSVGKKIKALASAFYGRVAAYEEGLDAADALVLEEALKRNVFPEAEPSPDDLKALADYVRRAADGLSALPVAALLKGETAFAALPEAVAERSGA
ncbi:MAG: ubiquinol-cytochrome C chaperone [Parvibaculum sp.]|uniref:ubiquinol-cytochrome C chaperone family protein n=1 Tax=Parvibaculum sp. TaxID=2024848 RepID=UPI0025D905D7|nr:ubiquinol-cytochrome C chaperone family protein [Parvibaculum sp.]MCE9650223.1 ubiquinol-cytochrome C chaperone [Parvibaculum sp.]